MQSYQYYQNYEAGNRYNDSVPQKNQNSFYENGNSSSSNQGIAQENYTEVENYSKVSSVNLDDLIDSGNLENSNAAALQRFEEEKKNRARVTNRPVLGVNNGDFKNGNISSNSNSSTNYVISGGGPSASSSGTGTNNFGTSFEKSYANNLKQSQFSSPFPSLQANNNNNVRSDITNNLNGVSPLSANRGLLNLDAKYQNYTNSGVKPVDPSNFTPPSRKQVDDKPSSTSIVEGLQNRFNTRSNAANGNSVSAEESVAYYNNLNNLNTANILKPPTRERTASSGSRINIVEEKGETGKNGNFRITMDIGEDLIDPTEALDTNIHARATEFGLTQFENVKIQYKGDAMVGNSPQKTYIDGGSFGSIYLAVHKKLNKVVAIKEAISDKENQHAMSKEQVQTFQRELDFFTALRSAVVDGAGPHMNIVEYIGCIMSGKNLSLVLEYVNGGNLFFLSTQQKKQFSRFQKLAYIHDLTLALSHVHRVLRFVHRDVKAQNIIVCYNDSPFSSFARWYKDPNFVDMGKAINEKNLRSYNCAKLCDFGKAKELFTREELSKVRVEELDKINGKIQTTITNSPKIGVSGKLTEKQELEKRRKLLEDELGKLNQVKDKSALLTQLEENGGSPRYNEMLSKTGLNNL